MTGTVQSPGLIDCVCGVDIEMLETVAIDKAVFAYSVRVKASVENNDGFKVFTVSECTACNRCYAFCDNDLFHIGIVECAASYAYNGFSAHLFGNANNFFISRISGYFNSTGGVFVFEKR